MSRNKRTFASLLFIVVFATKMMISVVPIFSMLDSKVAASVILQLEQETNGDKDSSDKDSFKEKKGFDEHIYFCFDYKPLLVQTSNLRSQHKALAVRLCHQVVPTPPPNI